MSIKSERDAYKAMATHLALALTSIAISAAVGVGIFITHNGWCLLGLIIIGAGYNAAFDIPSLHEAKKDEVETAS